MFGNLDPKVKPYKQPIAILRIIYWRRNNESAEIFYQANKKDWTTVLCFDTIWLQASSCQQKGMFINLLVQRWFIDKILTFCLNSVVRLTRQAYSDNPTAERFVQFTIVGW